MPSDLEEIDGVDPTQFLAQDDDEGVSNGEDQPPILTSLGLTHINHVNQPNCLVCFVFYIISFILCFCLLLRSVVAWFARCRSTCSMLTLSILFSLFLCVCQF